MTETAVQTQVQQPVVRGRVAIVEDHDLLAQSLAFALANLGVEVTTVPDVRPAATLEHLRGRELDVVLLDYDLGDAGLGVDLVRPITNLGPSVVMLTGETDPVRLAECVEAGALGLISKSEPFEHLVSQIDDVVTGRSILSVTTREHLLGELRSHRNAEHQRLAPFDRLTAREREVLLDIMDGKNAERIATESFVSVATVRSHIKALLAKLGVNSQLAAVAMARRAEWPTAEQSRRLA